jgi:peptidoglycan hydrolase CwlO-like protein
METDLESAAWKGESTGRSSAMPLWIWLVVLGLGALAIYAGFEALGRDQLYQEAEKARAALARDKDHLQANATDLNRQLDDANKRNDATEAALKQSRADTAAASGQIADLQAQVTKLQGQVTDLQGKAASAEGAVVTADANSKQATGVLQKEVDSLKAELAETQKKLAVALATAPQQSPKPPPATAP